MPMLDSDDSLSAKLKCHLSVFSTTFLRQGKILLAGTDIGRITCFRTSDLCSHSCEKNKKPILLFPVNKENSAIHDVASSPGLLLCAGVGFFKAWRMSDLNSLLTHSNVVSPIEFSPPPGESRKSFIVNSLALNSLHTGGENLNFVTAACENGKVYFYDLATGLLVRTFEERLEAVHCVKYTGNMCLLGCEDGIVEIWDVRMKRRIQGLEPHANEAAGRPHLGKWISSLDVDADGHWMICGGGPHVSTWHLGSMTCAGVLSPDVRCEKSGYHSVLLDGDSVFAGGDCNIVQHWGLSGEIRAMIKTDLPAVYSLSIGENNGNKFLVVAGASNCLHIGSGNVMEDSSIIVI